MRQAPLTQKAPQPEDSSPRHSKSLFISLKDSQKLIKSILKSIKTVEQRKIQTQQRIINKDYATPLETMPTSWFKPALGGSPQLEINFLTLTLRYESWHGLNMAYLSHHVLYYCTPDMLDSHLQMQGPFGGLFLTTTPSAHTLPVGCPPWPPIGKEASIYCLSQHVSQPRLFLVLKQIVPGSILERHWWDWRVVEWLRALVALAEQPGSVPSTFGRSVALFWLLGTMTKHECGAHP